MNKTLLEHKGLLMKTLVQQDNLPYVLPGSKRDANEVMAVHNSNLPICWNYDTSQYSDFQECNDSIQESDDFPTENVHEYEPAFTQESIEVGVAASFARPAFGLPDVNHGQIIQLLKKGLHYFDTPARRVALYEAILKCELDVKKDKMEKQGRQVLAPTDAMHVSLNLPHDSDRESKNYSYSRDKTWRACHVNNNGRNKRQRTDTVPTNSGNRNQAEITTGTI